MMLRNFIAALASAVLLMMPVQGASHPDFSGRWELNVSKSDFGNAEKPVRMTLVSENKDGYLHSVQTVYTAQGDQTSERDWYPDGKQHPSPGAEPGSSVTRWDGNTLTSERTSKDAQYKETIRLSMSADGKTATETVTSKNPNGTNKARLVWERK
jgi:hypothetical protein